jgi:hypothetical protein
MKLFRLVNPIAVTKVVVGLAGSAVGFAEATVRAVARIALSGLRQPDEPGDPFDGAGQTDSAPISGLNGSESAAAATDVEGAPKGPDIVPVEPHAPEEPPIDVLGQALAAESAMESREGVEDSGMADEAEEHLTQPLIDPADAKALAAEMRTMTRAADPNKG